MECVLTDRTLTKKITDKFATEIGKARNNIEGVKISLTSQYDRVKCEDVSHIFRQKLCANDNPLMRLFSRNSAAIQDAQKILAGHLRLMSLNVKFGEKDFSWHKDYYSGNVYPKVPHTRIKILSDKGHDIIVPWELSRLQFIPTLIQAYRVNREQKYADFFKRIVDDWILENQRFVGVNWYTGMDVAIRAINLALGFLFFHDSITERSEFYSKVLWSHAEYIYANDLRRHRGPRNNHFLISMVGLLVVSLCFRGKLACKFHSLAIQNLTSEINQQFRKDGGNFESATNYHQLSLEAVLVALCFLEVANSCNVSNKKNEQFDSDIKERIAKAIVMVSDYTNAFGQSTQFGDSSDGRILIYKDYYCWDPLDHSFIEELSSTVFPDNNFYSKGIAKNIYEDSGYGFFVNDQYGLCFNATKIGNNSPNGRGHNHCDKTSLVLQVNRTPVLVDSGTYCYTPDINARFAFKCSKAHNVVMLDDLEQAPITSQSVFGAPENMESGISYSNEGVPIWKMIHNGYSRIKGLGNILRNVKCFDEKLEIEDIVEGCGKHKIDILWHLSPDIRFEVTNGSVLFFLSNTLLCKLQVPKKFDVCIEDSFYSPAYLKKLNNKILIFTQEMQLPLSIQYSIFIEKNLKNYKPVNYKGELL